MNDGKLLHNELERSTTKLGQFTISTGPFSIAILNDKRVWEPETSAETIIAA